MENEFIGVTSEFEIIPNPPRTKNVKWLYHTKQNYFVKSGDRELNDIIESAIKGYIALLNRFNHCVENGP